MLKLFRYGFVFTVVTAFFLSSLAYAGDCNYTVGYLKKNVPLAVQNIKIVKQYRVDNDLCNIILKVKTPLGSRYISAFAVKSGGVIIGGMFKNGRPVSYEKIMTIRSAEYVRKFKKFYPKHIKDFQNSVMASYTPSNYNGKTAYVFVDPLCPYCRILERSLKEIANSTGYRMALVPLIVHGPTAARDVRNFICNGLTFNDYLKGKYGKNRDCKKAKRVMVTSWKIEKSLGIMGTPTIITSDGKVAFGADKSYVKEVLGGKKQKGVEAK